MGKLCRDRFYKPKPNAMKYPVRALKVGQRMRILNSPKRIQQIIYQAGIRAGMEFKTVRAEESSEAIVMRIA